MRMLLAAMFMFFSSGALACANNDFDGDGWGDLLWRNVVDGDVAIWFLDNGAALDNVEFVHFLPLYKPSGEFESGSPIFTDAPSLDWEIEKTSDLNGDCTADIVWRNVASGEVVNWIMVGHEIGKAISPGRADLMWQLAP